MYKSPSPTLQGIPNGDKRRNMKAKRVYQVWKGSNRFVLGGRLIFGPDAHSLFITLSLILAPSVVFCVFVLNLLTEELAYITQVSIMCGAAVYIFCVFVLLLLTSSRDPGIIPRNEHPPEPEDDYEASSGFSTDLGGQTPQPRLPRTKEVLVNGVSVKVKYCDTCMLYRPPRCSHCSICNNCVDRFDHHCPWVGQCIGRRNYPFFFMFIASTAVLCIAVFATSVLYIRKLMTDVNPNRSVWKAMSKSPAAIFLMAYTFIAVWFVGGLTLFHLYLVSSNQTTYENFRYRYDNRANPYNRGVLGNLKEVLCSGIPPSRNRFRERAKETNSGMGNRHAGERSTSNNSSPMSRIARSNIDIEMGVKPKWAAMVGGGEGLQHARGKGSNNDRAKRYEHNLASPPASKLRGDINNSLHQKAESSEITSERRLGFSGVNWEGNRPTGECTPPGNR